MKRAREDSNNRTLPRYGNFIRSPFQTHESSGPIVLNASNEDIVALLDDATKIAGMLPSTPRSSAASWGGAPSSQHINGHCTYLPNGGIPEIRVQSTETITFRRPPLQDTACCSDEAVPDHASSRFGSTIHHLHYPGIRNNQGKSPTSASTTKDGLVEKNSTKNSPAHSKRVIQIDLTTGEPIRVFRSMREAAKSVRVTGACIGNACHGRRPSAGGFGWKIVLPGDSLPDKVASNGVPRHASSTIARSASVHAALEPTPLSDKTEQELAYRRRNRDLLCAQPEQLPTDVAPTQPTGEQQETEFLSRLEGTLLDDSHDSLGFGSMSGSLSDRGWESVRRLGE